MADIFISYAREDRSRIEPLAKSLQDLGWSVFWDRTIPTGKTWRQVIGDALKNARSVIVAWSQNSIESDWVQEEADRGRRRNILIPILIDNVDPPLGFGAIQAADLTSWNPAQSSPEFEKLISDISIILGPSSKHVKKGGLSEEEERKQKQEEEKKTKEEEQRKAEEESQRLEEEERRKAKSPETELDATATTDVKPPEPRRTSRVWKVFAVACAIVLIIAMWFLIPRIIPSKGKIFVDVVPANAIIQILHVNQPFQPGMELKPGKYQVQVSLQDYETEDRWIELNANEEKLIKFDLKKILPKVGRLFVETNPENAAVRILNIQEKFNQGMGLKPGRYNLEASLDGYETQQGVVDIGPGEEKRINLRLAKLPPKVGRLFVETNPGNAAVRILDNQEKFNQGMSLKPGRYNLEASLDGYETQQQVVEIRPGEEKRINFELAKPPPRVGRLFIETTPVDAKVSVLNIKSKFTQGMGLEAGSYQVEVAAEGYETQRRLIDLEAGSKKQHKFELAKIKIGVPFLPQKVIKNSIGMEFVYISPGTFAMGSPETEQGRKDDERQHQVTLTRGFYMQTTEVTQRQWKAVMGNNPSGFKDCGEDCPVETVSWEDANTFIERLNQEDPAKRYSLPTEAQWEYAARADTKTPYSFGACLTTQQANYNGKNPLPGCQKGEYRQKTTPVKSFKPNKWGLYDMHGNVYEWCQDWYKKDFSSGVNDPEGPTTGADRVLRGGTWHCDPRNVRSSSRSWGNPTTRYRDDPDGRSYYYGLRLVLRPVQ